MRPAVTAIVDSLLKREERVLSLDLLGELIGTEAISFDEIETIIQTLEDAGRSVQGATQNMRGQLELVLREARRLKLKQNGAPSVAALADATGLDPSEVRSALLYASVLSRP